MLCIFYLRRARGTLDNLQVNSHRKTQSKIQLLLSLHQKAHSRYCAAPVVVRLPVFCRAVSQSSRLSGRPLQRPTPHPTVAVSHSIVKADPTRMSSSITQWVRYRLPVAEKRLASALAGSARALKGQSHGRDCMKTRLGLRLMYFQTGWLAASQAPVSS